MPTICRRFCCIIILCQKCIYSICYINITNERKINIYLTKTNIFFMLPPNPLLMTIIQWNLSRAYKLWWDDTTSPEVILWNISGKCSAILSSPFFHLCYLKKKKKLKGRSSTELFDAKEMRRNKNTNTH